jgi:hypothetical protein
MWNTTKSDLSLFDRVEKSDVAQGMQRRRHQSGADVDDRHGRVGCRQRVDDAHLIGDRGGVDDFADLAMETFERSLWRFGVERARRHMMCGEIIEQGPGDGGLANAPLVRAN